MKAIATLVFAAATTFASLSAHALTMSDKVGTASPAAAAQRTIVVDANTRAVNVAYGDTIHFVKDGQDVTWTFDGILPVISLSALLPNAGNVQVYIAQPVVS